MPSRDFLSLPLRVMDDPEERHVGDRMMPAVTPPTTVPGSFPLLRLVVKEKVLAVEGDGHSWIWLTEDNARYT